MSRELRLRGGHDRRDLSHDAVGLGRGGKVLTRYRSVRLVFLGLIVAFPFLLGKAAHQPPGPLLAVEMLAVVVGLIFAGHKRRRLLAGIQVVEIGAPPPPHASPEPDGWLHRLVRVEVDLDGDKIRLSRLRRREPADQPLLKELHHHLKTRRF